MPSLKEFFLSLKNENSKLPLTSSKGQIAEMIKADISAVLSGSLAIANSNKDKFGKEVANMVESEEFLDDLSKEIGKPRANESENEFVERGKQTMKKLLMSNLIK